MLGPYNEYFRLQIKQNQLEWGMLFVSQSPNRNFLLKIPLLLN